MTTIAHAAKVLELARRIGIDRSDSPCAAHVLIREWVNSALGLTDHSAETLARQMVVPWLMFEHYFGAVADSRGWWQRAQPGSLKLRASHVPAAHIAWRSLNSIPQGFEGILAALDFIGKGVTPQEFREPHAGRSCWNVKEATLNSTAYTLQRQFGVIRKEGDRYVRTERGEKSLSVLARSGRVG